MGLAGLAVIWLLAWGGYRTFQKTRVTADKVRAYATAIDLSQLDPEARARALRELARQLNQLPLEERRRLRLERAWAGWFGQMTEEEKGWFVEATLPTGFQQMLVSFEKMPEQQRRVALDEGLKRLREARQALEAEGEEVDEGTTNAPAELSEALRQQVVTIGLRTYYSQSSAQTKAEMAPLLEEIQQMMESGRFFRRRHGGPP
jgi:hypothetical protein